MKMQKFAIFVIKFEEKYAKDKKYSRARDHCNFTQVNIEVLHIAYVI